MTKRTAEFTLGLIGGIIGFFAAIAVVFIGGVAGAVGASDAGFFSNLGWSSLLFSILGIVGASLVKSKTKVGGWLMVVSAVGGIISISMFYLLSFVLLLCGGLMALIRKEK